MADLMKKFVVAAACMAAALMLLSGCGAALKPENRTDGAAAQNGAEAGMDGGTAQNGAGADSDDGTVQNGSEASLDGGAAQNGAGADSDGGAAQNGSEAGMDEGTMRNAGETGRESQASAGSKPEPPTGRTLSILGDSISTFRGYNLEGYAVFFPDFGEVTAVEDTWWQRVVNDLGLILYQNGSSSGATVAGNSTGTTDPACACNELRTDDLAGPEGVCPELLIVYLGTNDMMESVPLGTNDGTTPVEEGEIKTFSDAYTLMLDKLQAKYPQAQIYCCTLLPMGINGTETPYVEWMNGIGLTAADYSKVIGQIAENKGLRVIDLQECGIAIENLAEMTTDGVHPKPAGMKCIAEAVKKALEAR